MGRRIKMDHWFIDNNELSISLMNLYVDLTIYREKVFERIVDNNMNEKYYEFNSLEDGIYFAEDYIKYLFTLEEVDEQYKKFKNGNNLSRKLY